MVNLVDLHATVRPFILKPPLGLIKIEATILGPKTRAVARRAIATLCSLNKSLLKSSSPMRR